MEVEHVKSSGHEARLDRRAPLMCFIALIALFASKREL